MRILGREVNLDARAIRPAVAALVTLIAIGAFASREDDVVSWVFLAPTVVAYWTWALGSGRLSWPVHVLGLWVPLVLNIIESDDEVSMLIAVVTMAVVAASLPDRHFVRIALTFHMLLTATLGIVGAISDFNWPIWLMGFAFAWGTGELVWRLTETVDELEEARALVADQAALQERQRIARDVHDLVGHSLTVVMLHVTGARHLVHKDPHEAERALIEAEQAGRQSMAEIRRTVGLLRTETDAVLEIMPSTDLLDIPGLVQDFAVAGLDVGVDVAGPIDLVDPAVGLAGYRIVQEALTNVSRHARGSRADVTIRVGDDSCEISVMNSSGVASGITSGSGFGLVSMRERAKSVGGSLLAGPHGNGWRVEASLPINAPRSIR